MTSKISLLKITNNIQINIKKYSKITKIYDVDV